jgi:hypothetical protein
MNIYNCATHKKVQHVLKGFQYFIFFFGCLGGERNKSFQKDNAQFFLNYKILTFSL